ncbi:MAG: flavodoxin family protein [Clostridia bacterium]
MALTNKDMVNVLNTEDVKVNILVLNGSPKKNSNSQIPMDAAIEAIQKIPGVNLDTFYFAGKKLEFCRHCLNYCNEHLECIHKDDFNEFKTKWLWADGIVWVSPVYHMGPPAKVRAVLDRLSEVEFHTVHRRSLTENCGYIYPKFSKAVGAIIHGATRYGGQEITIQYFINHAVLLDCFPVSGDMPECYLGAAGHSPSREALENDKSFLHSAASVGRRVVETAKILKAGLMLSCDSMDKQWFPSKETMGAMDKESFIARMNSD